MTVSQCNITFQDSSNDVNNSSIVIFQHNATMDTDSVAVAWKVLKGLGNGLCRDVVYPYALSIGVRDFQGNYSCPPVPVGDGDLATFTSDSAQPLKIASGQSSNPEEVQCLNGLGKGSLDISLYRDGKVLHTQPNVAPKELGAFKFLPKIYCAVVSNVEEGDVLHSATVMQNAMEIDLTGVSSTTIRLTGGGKGAECLPFQFRPVSEVRF